MRKPHELATKDDKITVMMKEAIGQTDFNKIVDKIKSIFWTTMKMLGINFAPRDVPMERRLQTLAAAAWIGLMMFSEIIAVFLTVYLIRSSYYWIMLIYAVIIAKNRNNCNFGAHSWSWVRNWSWWNYFRDYFPLKLVKTQDLDPENNYLFCVFPHGVLATGCFGNFATDATGFPRLFPGLTPHMLTLAGHFMVPFFRELISWLGVCSASAESITFLLDKRKGKGRCAILVVGGAAESLNCHAGEYKVVLKNRKGFIKLAMKAGAPLVPVISFGETDLYEQISNPPGGFVRQCQEYFKKVTGVAPVVPLGRGIFQYSFGIVPQRRPVTTVVGKPMEVALNYNPSDDEINRVHEEFTKNLINMFDEEKSKYISAHKNTHLVIE